MKLFIFFILGNYELKVMVSNVYFFFIFIFKYFVIVFVNDI